MRDDFSQQTLDILAKRVGVRCSNPGCRKLTTGPRSDSALAINIGVGAHITAASEGGSRFDQTLSKTQRKSVDNGIWLCQNCAKLVDNDPVRYTIDILKNWKQQAEGFALSAVERSPTEKTIEPETTVDLEISYKKVRVASERHDYLLEVRLRNVGDEILNAYHVDLEFPAQVVESPQEISSYVQERSNRKVCFFRGTQQNNNAVRIHPGDTAVVISIPYYMDHQIYFGRGGLLAQTVRATLYRAGFRPLTVEKPFGELQLF